MQQSLPKIAIVGRPNVGKSALFNRVCQKKIAIVDEAEGVTRDRIYQNAELFGRPFEVIDTGGIDPRSEAAFNEHIKQQAEIAIEEADSLIMVVDGQVGLTTLDQELSKILLRTKKPICLAVNKVDGPAQKDLLFPFYQLGITKIIPVSATQNWHIAELLEAALNPIPVQEKIEEELPSLKIAIVGRPNVGKSSLVNYLLDENRLVVSPIPGTTRDSVNVHFTHDGNLYTLVDTAGIRKKKSETEAVEKFAAIRTERAIEDADLCLLMLDAREGMTTYDKRIAKEIEEQGKGCILIFNKWDLVKGFRMEHCLEGIEQEVPFLLHCPKLFMSALSGRNVEKIFPLIQEVSAASKMRVTTGQLNKFIGRAMQRVHPPMIKGKRLRIYYLAQVGITPPTFVLFVNYPDLMQDSYQKYLINQFRENFPFQGVPLVFRLKKRERENRNLGTNNREDEHEHSQEEEQEEPKSHHLETFEDNLD